jgi:hypothetical protein
VVNLQLTRELANLCLNSSVLVLINGRTGLFDKVVGNLKGNTSKLFGVAVLVGLARYLWSSAQPILLVRCGEFIPGKEGNV